MVEKSPRERLSLGRLLPWLPVVVVGCGVVATAAVAQFQIESHSEKFNAVEKEYKELELDVEGNADDINVMRRLLLEQRSEQRLAIESLKGDIKVILRLLQQQEDRRDR